MIKPVTVGLGDGGARINEGGGMYMMLRRLRKMSLVGDSASMHNMES